MNDAHDLPLADETSLSQNWEVHDPELGLRLCQQALAAEFAMFTLGVDELQPILDEACRIAAEGMRCSLAKVLEYLPGEDCFLMRAGVGWAAGTVGIARLGSDRASPAGYAFQTGEPVLSNHLAKETRFRTPELLVTHGVHRAFNVLVHTPQWRFGVLEVDSPDQRDFSLLDTAFLQSLAATLAQAISKQRRLEELRDSKAFVQGVLEASPDCIKVLAADGTVLFMNHRGLEMNELASIHEVVNHEFAAMWPESEQEAIRDGVRRALAGELAHAKGYCPTATGRPRWWELRFASYQNKPDHAPQVICISRDVSDRHDAEEALHGLNATLERRVEERTRDVLRSEAQRQAYYDASPEYLVMFELRGEAGLVYVDVNNAVERLYGRSRAEIIGQAPRDIMSNDAATLIERHTAECVRTGAAVRFETIRTGPGGSQHTISVVAAPVPLPGGDRQLIVFCGRDITDQRVAEDALRQSQKMEAVGQLTGGLAHDFNNMLTGITGSLELLSTRIAQGRFSELDRYIAAAQGAAKRAAALTHRLLAFSRRQTLDAKPVDTKRLVTGLEELVSRTVGPGVTLAVHMSDDTGTAFCDPNQLENALLNLCINARDAMPQGGRLTIASHNVDVQADGAAILDMPARDYVALCVTDTGTGMSPDVVARAFDPFFTTKPLGQGTGLGLSMIYGFAEQSGGQVRLHSVEGQGTTVTLYLPRHRGELAPEQRPVPLVSAPRAEQGEIVLVVDDEPTVRMLLTEVLEDLGYAAVEAADAASGLKVLQSDIRIDLLITDVGLPGGMNGREMADAARIARPGLKVLFITGYAQGASLNDELPRDGIQIMTKPFAMEALASRIKEMIVAV